MEPSAEAWARRLLESLGHSRGRQPLPSMDRSGLLLVDLQALFVHEDSPAYLPAWKRAGPRCRALLQAARAKGLPVIWTRHVHPPDDEGGTIHHFFGRLLRGDDPLAALAPEWQPQEGEVQVEKSRHPAFHGTNLAERLGRLGIQTLVLAGVQANLCILATAVWAGALDFVPVVAVDAVASKLEREHVSAVQVLASGLAHVATVEEILAAWFDPAAEGADAAPRRRP